MLALKHDMNNMIIKIVPICAESGWLSRPGARIAWLGGHEKFIYVNSREARGHEKFFPVWIKRTRWRPKKRSSLKFRGIFRPKSEIQTVSPAVNMWSPKKGLYPKNFVKSGVSPQKLRICGCQTPILASICTLVAPILLISSGHSPRLGRHKQSFGGGKAPECPPWRRSCDWERLNVIPDEMYLQIWSR